MNRLSVLTAVIALSVIAAIGCSGGKTNPATPASDLAVNATVNPVQTHLWAYYDVYIDIPTQTATAVPSRGAMYTANVVEFVNKPVSNLSFVIKGTSTEAGHVDVDIDVSITHPFPGLTQYNGYDVRGIFIGNANAALKYNTELKYAVHKGTADQEMYDYALTGDPGKYGNPDGYTRWFNPTEFGTTGIFGYTNGKVASAGYTGTATLNPYKYFADGLLVAGNAYNFMITTTGHGVFSAGKTNTRNYYLRFPDAIGVRFNYAIVANWIDETTHPANAPEACAISASVVPDLYFVSSTDKGGRLILNMSFPKKWGAIHDAIYIESSVLNDPYKLSTSEMLPTGGTDAYSTYHVEVTADHITGKTGNEYWIIAQYDGYDYKNTFGVTNLAGNDKLAAFFRYDLDVSSTPYNHAPNAAFNIVTPMPQIVLYLAPVLFHSTSSDPDPGETASLTYAWDFDGDNIFGEVADDMYTGAPTDPTHIYYDTYKGVVHLKVTDVHGASSIATSDPLDVTFTGPPGGLIWAKSAGGSFSESGVGITTLSDNSTVVTGSFTDTATFGQGEANETILTGLGIGNFFIARYSPDGTLAWAKKALGGAGAGITSLSDNSTVVTGWYLESAIFGPGETHETLLIGDWAGDFNMFIARYNPDGTLNWAKSTGDGSPAWGYAITALSDDSTVVTGEFSDWAIFGPGESNEITLYSPVWAFFIARYNPDGLLAWAKGGPGSGTYGITALSDNSIVLPGGGYFIARYNSDGSFAWGKDATEAYAYAVTTCSDDSTVVTGIHYDGATFGPGEPNETVLNGYGILIARYNPDGTLAWAKGILGGEGDGITTRSDNSTVVTGLFYGSATFGPGEPNETVLTSEGNCDIFVACYNPNGTLKWAKSAGGSSVDFGLGITTLSDNSTVATGWFDVSATFGSGEPNETVLTSAGERDIFIARFAH